MSKDAGIYYQGWIHKKNDNKFMGEKWNKRWFVLYEHGILTYYGNQVLKDEKNSLDLKGSKLKVLPKDHNKRRPYCLELVTKNRTFLLSFQSEQDYRSWMYWLSKGHPEAPQDRSRAFFNTVIEQVLQEAEKQNRRQSLTRCVTAAAAATLNRGKDWLHSGEEQKTSKPTSPCGASPPCMKSEGDSRFLTPTRSPSLSRSWFHVETKENEVSLSPPVSEFANKLQDFVKANEQTMKEVIGYLVHTVNEQKI